MTERGCDRWLVDQGEACGDGDVQLYPGGLFCPAHSPAALAGRVVPTPDPLLTVAGMRARQVSGFAGDRSRYGTATDDPLGRTVPPDPKAGMLPRYPCEACAPVLRPVGHKGDHVG